MLWVRKMVFACDNCHYLFSRVKEPEQCPDCGKYRVRPAREDEQREFEAQISDKDKERGGSSLLMNADKEVQKIKLT